MSEDVLLFHSVVYSLMVVSKTQYSGVKGALPLYKPRSGVLITRRAEPVEVSKQAYCGFWNRT